MAVSKEQPQFQPAVTDQENLADESEDERNIQVLEAPGKQDLKGAPSSEEFTDRK